MDDETAEMEEITAQMRDINALDDSRRLRQTQHFAQSGHAFFRLDLKDFRLHVPVDVAA